MWHLRAHDNSFAIALNQAFPQEKILKTIPLSSSLISTDIEAYMTLSKKIVYSHGDQGDQLIMAPYPWKIITVGRLLQNEGWSVQYLGGVVRASKKNNPEVEVSLTQAIKAALQSITTYSYPLNPLLLAESGPLSALSEPIFAIGSVVGPRIHVDIHQGSNPEPFSAPQPVKPAVLPEVVYPEYVVLSVPGALLTHFPQDVQASLTEQLAKMFGFVKKQPDFIKKLSEFDQVVLYVNKQDVAIAVNSAPTFIDTAHHWLQEEERRYRIERRAFLLPDKTRGFEYVPAEAQAVVEPDPAHPDCLRTSQGQIQASICTTGTYTILTNNPAVISKMVLPPAGENYIQLGAAWLQRLGLSGIEEGMLHSSPPWNHLDLKLSPL